MAVNGVLSWNHTRETMTYDILFNVFYEIPIGVLLRFCDVFDANEYHCGLEKCWERNHGSEIYSSNHDKANVKCQALRYLKALAYCVFYFVPCWFSHDTLQQGRAPGGGQFSVSYLQMKCIQWIGKHLW